MSQGRYWTRGSGLPDVRTAARALGRSRPIRNPTTEGPSPFRDLLQAALVFQGDGWPGSSQLPPPGLGSLQEPEQEGPGRDRDPTRCDGQDFEGGEPATAGGRLAPVTELVLLPAATGTGFVASDLGDGPGRGFLAELLGVGIQGRGLGWRGLRVSLPEVQIVPQRDRHQGIERDSQPLGVGGGFGFQRIGQPDCGHRGHAFSLG